MNWIQLLEKLTEMKDEPFMNEKVKCFDTDFQSLRLTQDLSTGELLLIPEEAPTGNEDD